MESQEQEKKPSPGAEKYAMDFGIVRISKLASGDHRMHLPVSVSVDPCEGQIEEKLKKVLEFKTLGQTLVKLLRPVVTDRSILTPQKFRLKIRHVCESLENAMENGGESFSFTELFEECVDLLKNEEEKCELLDQYRHMLLMG
jgi:hypothetical protein